MRKVKLTEDQLTDLVHQILESKNKHVCCERCDWEWDIVAEDEDPYLCHMCGHRNDKKENKEGAGPYDAPAFEMEPDHTTFKHEFSEQPDEDEPQRDYITIEFNDEPFKKLQQTETLKGPLKIIYDKLYDKEFVAKEDDLEVVYIFGGFSYGYKYQVFFRSEDEMDKNYVSAKVIIKKVLYGGKDVTSLVKKITEKGGWTRHVVKGDAYNRLGTISKNLGLSVGKIRVDFFYW